MKKLYVYLARRDKKGAKLLTVLQGNTQTIQLPDISILNLPKPIEKELKSIVFENRMLWELWIENADSYQELRQSLKRRGYSNVDSDGRPVYDKTDLRNLIEANVKKIPGFRTMTRKC